MPLNISVCNLTLHNGLCVTVPAAINLMTPYILREQQDWFENELGFMKTVIKPGSQVLDIGANYGLYTLELANLVGPDGRVWAFEPAGQTLECLRHSIIENKFSNIELIQAALSNRAGEADFFTCHNSEWNSLHEIAVDGSSRERVKVLTLDLCQKEHGWNHLDFIKLDAEGEELSILTGGSNLLTSTSPLVMYEFKHNEQVNTRLIDAFNDLNYASFRYIPGLNILAPFEHDMPVDMFLLNLFACKQDRARELEDTGILAVGPRTELNVTDPAVIEKYLAALPCWQHISNRVSIKPLEAGPYMECLSWYILAKSGHLAAVDRHGLLMAALERARQMLDQGEQSVERLATFSRIAFDAGERVFGLQILVSLISSYSELLNFTITSPFLPAAEKYEQLAPGDDPNAWLLASVLEQFILMHAYSSYFSRRQTLPVFMRLQELGYLDAAMQSRKHLIETTFPDT